jgi:eukaryotic-like serine/threonine-protein kinase
MSSTLPEDEVFEAARSLADPAERLAYLIRACGADAEMRTRIEALLAAAQEAESFFAATSPALEPATDVPTGETGLTARAAQLAAHVLGEESIGNRIGRYKLVKKLGEGGCGIVYLAEQEEPVRRQVALKIIKLGMETRSVIARFEAERQALAMMDHPYIARVFDAGATDRGPPYFVMELVSGVRITDFCDRHRLDVGQRLQLFIEICHAIQHAHQKGIIHGDIKPSNILVTRQDGRPAPKVIDFGIARATEARLTDKGLTAFTQLIGTPTYMSPEQANISRGGIDTRSDIYSLGVLLYELLTGRPPFSAQELTAAGLDEMKRILREREPPRPSAALAAQAGPAQQRTAELRRTDPHRLSGLLRGDLDWIVMKALEKDRTRRYETTNGLAMDVQRHLQHEPVLARPASWSYRFRKVVRRNRGLFAAGSAITAALLAGTSTSTYLFLKERDSRQRAVAAEQQQARLRYEAEVRERVTHAALLVSQERFAEAGEVLRELSLTHASLEGAAVHRAVGEWHALQHQWKEASEHFGVMVRINQLDGPDTATLDYLEYGPVLLAAEDLAAYEQFRAQAVARFGALPIAGSDRIVKITLLLPAEAGFLESLQPLVRLTLQAVTEAEANGDLFQAAWRSVSLALWEYRRGNYESAIQWARRCLAYPEHNAPRSATARVILALALQRTGAVEAAARELQQSAEAIETRLNAGRVDRGSPVHGFWFDWLFAGILLEEAQSSRR